MSDDNGHDELVMSHLVLRRTLGVLGLLFPVLLSLLCWLFYECRGIKPSISDYYHSGVRDGFVGFLIAIGLFLFAYRGHNERPGDRDNIIGNLGAVFAIGVALFPTASEVSLFRTLHTISATLLFLTFAYFSLRLFTKTKEGQDPTEEKLQRNRFYKLCGYVILACIALIAVFFLFFEDSALKEYRPVFWLESIALWAFGWSWLVKGETLWKDDPPPSPVP